MIFIAVVGRQMTTETLQITIKKNHTYDLFAS